MTLVKVFFRYKISDKTGNPVIPVHITHIVKIEACVIQAVRDYLAAPAAQAENKEEN